MQSNKKITIDENGKSILQKLTLDSITILITKAVGNIHFLFFL